MNDLKSKFVPGLDLCQAFFNEIVHPILNRSFAGIEFSAARLGHGSEVLGFDTPQSMDHDWGPARIDLFLKEDDCDSLAENINTVLAEELPSMFRGIPTNFPVDFLVTPEAKNGLVPHRITCTSIDRFFCDYIGLNPLNGLQDVDWLVIAPQYLRTISSGKVFYDGLNQLCDIQTTIINYYPSDVWFYLLSGQWGRISQESPFMARCGDVGDEIGSRLIATRMIDEMVKLCFLMEQQYWPYSKWFGTAFSRLTCSKVLTPIFELILNAQDWKSRERHLSSAYIYIAEIHNTLGITDFIEPKIVSFHERPYKVPQADLFNAALYSKIESETILKWPKNIGSIGQFVHSTDVLDCVSHCKKLATIYE